MRKGGTKEGKEREEWRRDEGTEGREEQRKDVAS